MLSLIFQLKLIANTCTDFSGVYLSDDKKAWERCIEIRQSNCEFYDYYWHLSDGGNIHMKVITDSRFREYYHQEGIFKSFSHQNDSSLVFQFYKDYEPNIVSERINKMKVNGNFSTYFYPDNNDLSNVRKANFRRMKSPEQCMDELDKE